MIGTQHLNSGEPSLGGPVRRESVANSVSMARARRHELDSPHCSGDRNVQHLGRRQGQLRLPYLRLNVSLFLTRLLRHLRLHHCLYVGCRWWQGPGHGKVCCPACCNGYSHAKGVKRHTVLQHKLRCDNCNKNLVAFESREELERATELCRQARRL